MYSQERLATSSLFINLYLCIKAVQYNATDNVSYMHIFTKLDGSPPDIAPFSLHTRQQPDVYTHSEQISHAVIIKLYFKKFYLLIFNSVLVHKNFMVE